MKKAQMEIMGLAVIVILLALAMFFVTKFTLFKQESGQELSFQQSQAAIGFVNTLLNTNSGCESASFTKLIEEMATPRYSILSCGEETLEEHYISSVTYILSQTMDLWGYKYELKVSFPLASEKEDIIIQKDCENAVQQEAAPPFPIPTDYGIVIVIMKICS